MGGEKLSSVSGRCADRLPGMRGVGVTNGAPPGDVTVMGRKVSKQLPPRFHLLRAARGTLNKELIGRWRRR